MLTNSLHTFFLLLVLFSFNTNLSGEEHIFERKKALIFGATGQDGTYLTELLLEKNYEVHGIARHSPPSTLFSHKSFHDHPNYFFQIGDITKFSDVVNLIGFIQPDEIYNLAAQSHVKTSFNLPIETSQINALGTLRVLESIRILGLAKKTKIFQASSSELFNHLNNGPKIETSSFHPHNPYAVSKIYGYWITVNYRESYGVFACNGILFNHESPLRNESFVTRKITRAACRCKLGLQDVLYLGNLNSKRDWGYAKDYVEAMWLMLQQEQPEDYVIATGESHSVRECVELAFSLVGIQIEWRGQGVEEFGIDKETGEVIVKVDPKYYRPNEGEFVVGNAEKATNNLNWNPKTRFSDLIRLMVEEDYQLALTEKNLLSTQP